MNVLLITDKDASTDRIKALITGSLGECEFINCSPGLTVLTVTGSFSPDLAVIHLDQQVAEVPGLVRHLKSMESPGYILLVVGSEDFTLVEQAVDAGADDFIIGELVDRELAIRLKRAVRSTVGTRDEMDRCQSRRSPVSGERPSKAPTPLAGAVRITGNVAFGALLVVMAVLAFFLVQSKFSEGVPSVFGNQMYIVLSGSMSPAFDTGSLAFVRAADPETIRVGDIITFGNPAGGVLTTHRVVAVNHEDGLKFTTRGDANNVDDPNPVPAENVVGRVHGSVPYLGYLMGFSQTRQGLIFLVFIPGVLVIVYELRNIFKYMGEMDKDKKKPAGGGDSRRKPSARHKTRGSNSRYVSNYGDPPSPTNE